MRRGVPSLGALQAFEATARHENFSKAADELSQTHGAVCKKVNELEQDLGVALFHRVRQRLVLTPAGAEYARRIRVHLDQIRRDTLELVHAERAPQLEVAVGVTFGAQWLVPRLDEFHREHPDIQLHLLGRDQPNFFQDSNFDATIYSGTHLWTGMDGCVLIGDDELLPVASPRHAVPGRMLDLSEIVERPWISIRDIVGAWTDWTESLAGREVARQAATHHYNMFIMAINAAVAGQGVTLLPRSLIERELATGTLVIVHPHAIPNPHTMYFAFPEQRRHWAPVQRFGEWVQRAAERYRQQADPVAQAALSR